MKQKQNPKRSFRDLVSTAECTNVLSKSDTTNWTYRFYQIPEIFIEAIPLWQTSETTGNV